ncbi:MAG TPA: pyruvate formate lyase family protein [Anaerolineae bacterium]|nr:pyruvate formate lyase family protein [Anaerolineae bacterium]HQI83224.1 pyruvate formate lyase family protein [Anaerolineae bacterium]
MQTDARIACLRERVLARKDNAAVARALANPVTAAQSLRASEDCDSWTIRRGRLTRDRLLATRFAIDDLELLAGRLDLTAEPLPEEMEAARAYLAPYPLDQPGQTGHCELDLDPLMTLGIDGLAADIRAHLGDAATDVTYHSFLDALDGLSGMIEHAAETVEAAIPTATEERRGELRAIAASCRRIAHAAPASFRDAIQLLWFVIFGVMHGDIAYLVAPGHLDRTLWPFYQADIARGALTFADALTLIECLYLLLNEYIADGLAIPVMVGGRDAAGNDVTNALSYLCLEALRRTKLIYPTVGVCWHAGTPPALTDLAVDLMGHGYATPAIFGDATIQRGLAALGVPPEEACRYMNSTCVEITPSGASNVWVASPYYNTCGLLLEEIAAQTDTPAPTFDAFWARYQARLADAIAAGVAEQNAARRVRQQHTRRPLQSVFTRDCVARGRDIEDGGARYNWIECSFIGLANLADALYVIREEVYRQGRMSLATLQAVLDADFVGHEPTRQRFLNAYPKYGQGNAAVDALMGDLVQFVARTCAQFSVEPDGSPYVPGAFAWIMHERLGRETGATPDGRRAGFPFADGCGPAQGREACGPTAAVLSVTSWEHSPMIGGLAYNLKFNSSLFRSPEGFDGLRTLLLTYLRRGGFEAQVNVLDAETLKAARTAPELYRDLVVRIGGYCDYFTRLSPEMQDELILRTEFGGF